MIQSRMVKAKDVGVNCPQLVVAIRAEFKGYQKFTNFIQ